MKSGNLSLLEPSGPLQACNGTALTFTFTRINHKIVLVTKLIGFLRYGTNGTE